jgi:hypothetical protein
MTFVHIDVTHVMHTCPADPEPHVYDTRRTIVAVVDGGPCRHPIIGRSGDMTAVVACGRHEPHDRQCPACRTVVIERHITTQLAATAAQHPTPGAAA